jgi:hypothetical protein
LGTTLDLPLSIGGRGADLIGNELFRARGGLVPRIGGIENPAFDFAKGRSERALVTCR